MISRTRIELVTSYFLFLWQDLWKRIRPEVASFINEEDLPLVERVVERELAVLVRYWMTRDLWDVYGEETDAAREVNLMLLRRFTQECKVPRDGSGLKYAELGSLKEQLRELCHRIAHGAPSAEKPLFQWIEGCFEGWRRQIQKEAQEVCASSDGQLRQRISAWIESSTIEDSRV